MRDAAAYLAQLQALLPSGAAWSRDPDAVLTRLLGAIADGLARLDARGMRLLDEAGPLSALELLPDWERAVGLPDACVPVAGSTRERQVAVAQKIAGLGGQSVPYFIDLAAQLGLEVEIDEFRPFAAGSRAGTPLFGPAWSFAWRVRALPPSESDGDAAQLRFTHFRAGSRAGEPLRIVRLESLECVIGRARPAHTALIFAYPQDPEPLLWFDFAQAA